MDDPRGLHRTDEVTGTNYGMFDCTQGQTDRITDSWRNQPRPRQSTWRRPGYQPQPDVCSVGISPGKGGQYHDKGLNWGNNCHSCRVHVYDVISSLVWRNLNSLLCLTKVKLRKNAIYCSASFRTSRPRLDRRWPMSRARQSSYRH